MTKAADQNERVLFVHAHPDDESITTGGTIATLIDGGAAVTVVTCTRGERGEVIADDLKYLEASSVALTAHRVEELGEAMHALGVTDHRFLGGDGARVAGSGPRQYTDSGMQWGPSGAMALAESGPDSLSAAELGDVVADIATVIASVSPTAVISHDETGGYGHPDHVRAYEASRWAAHVMGVPFFTVAPQGVVTATDRAVDVSPVLEKKTRALSAYRSQLAVRDGFIHHPGGQQEPISVVERFSAIDPPPPRGTTWRERNTWWKVAVGILALLGGVSIGLLASVFYLVTSDRPLADVWGGLAAGMAIAAAFLAGLRMASGTRILAVCASAGFLLAYGIVILDGGMLPEITPANAADLMWFFMPVAIVVIVLAWPGGGAFSRTTMEEKLAKRKAVDEQ